MLKTVHSKNKEIVLKEQQEFQAGLKTGGKNNPDKVDAVMICGIFSPKLS